MATTTQTQGRYDHRLRNLVRTTRDIHCAIEGGVPLSTARGRLTGPDAPIVTFDAVDNRKQTRSASEPVTVSLK